VTRASAYVLSMKPLRLFAPAALIAALLIAGAPSALGAGA
jgi:hypothetical protein